VPSGSDVGARAALLVKAMDTSGAVMQRATVTVRRTSDQTLWSGKTNAGLALFSLDKPGEYDVMVEYPGFFPSKMRHLKVKAGCRTEIMMLLEQCRSTSNDPGC
jgi:hypothetical protein